MGWLVGGGGAMVLLPVVCVVLFVAVSLFSKDVEEFLSGPKRRRPELLINSAQFFCHINLLPSPTFDNG